MTNPVYATLGPAGSNHDLVLGAYLAREDIAATQLLCDDFDDALEACKSGHAHRIMICAAHPSCGFVIGTAQYKLNLKIADVFLSESQALAILSSVETPKTIGLHPSTRSYTDLSAFETVIEVSSTIEAAKGLKAGKWEAALTAARFADETSTLLQNIDPPRDAWLVLGGETLLEAHSLAN